MIGSVNAIRFGAKVVLNIPAYKNESSILKGGIRHLIFTDPEQQAAVNETNAYSPVATRAVISFDANEPMPETLKKYCSPAHFDKARVLQICANSKDLVIGGGTASDITALNNKQITSRNHANIIRALICLLDKATVEGETPLNQVWQNDLYENLGHLHAHLRGLIQQFEDPEASIHRKTRKFFSGFAFLFGVGSDLFHLIKERINKK